MGSGHLEISTNKELLDIDYIHRFLAGSYWAAGIPRHAVEKSISNSFCFGVYENKKQVGFARVITDFTTFGYLADVFIDEVRRGEGLGKALLNRIFSHPELTGLRRWHLLTADAHGVYRTFGFHAPEDPAAHMEKRQPPKY